MSHLITPLEQETDFFGGGCCCCCLFFIPGFVSSAPLLFPQGRLSRAIHLLLWETEILGCCMLPLSFITFFSLWIKNFVGGGKTIKRLSFF